MFASKNSGSSTDHDHSTNSVSLIIHRDKLFSAVFYGCASLAVIFTNKAIMTEYNFPFFDFLAAIQFISTTFVLTILILLKKIEVPYLNYSIVVEILPVSLMFLGNVICGLGSTKSLNLPMFTALRRFSILMTMIAEYCFLNSRPSYYIIFSIMMMVGGALVAAAYDLSFDTFGYTLVFFNNLFTALNGVWMKKASMSGKCSKMGVLFYNSLFSAVFMFSFFTVEYVYLSRQAVLAEGGQWRPGLYLHTGTNSPQRRLVESTGLAAMMTTTSTDIVVMPKYGGGLEGQSRIHRSTDKTLLEMHSQEPFSKSLDSFTLPFSLGATSSYASFTRKMVSRMERFLAAEIPSSNLRGASTKRITQVVPKRVSSNPDPTPPNNTPKPDSSNTNTASQQNLGTLSRIYHFEKWNDYTFICMFLLASFMGSILNYSIFLCTTLNSALTTAVVGALKNVAVTYIGMVLFGDYNFSWVNFLGINISIAGSLYYTYITIFKGVKGFGGV